MRNTSIVIVWASFAWLSAYLALRKRLGDQVDITLIDQRDKFTYTPSLHETLMCDKQLDAIQFDLQEVYQQDFLHATISSIKKDKVITLSDGSILTPDYIIIATWSRTNYFGKQDFEQYTYSVRHPEDISPLNTTLKTVKHIAVIGWWVTWVELASIIASRKHPDQHITLIHSRDRTFHTFHEQVGKRTQDRLTKHGCDLILWDRASEITADKIILQSGQELISDCTILSSGIKINDEPYNGSVTFETDYDALESEYIYCAGDVAIHGLYTTAHNAMVEWRHVGHLAADHIQWITNTYKPLSNRKEVAIALWTHDGIITNNERWRYIPFVTGLIKKFVEKRVMLEFKNKIMLPI